MEPDRVDRSRDRIVSADFIRAWSGAFAFYFSFYLLLPALPLYARTLGIPESQIGFIIGFFALSSMVVKPLAGWAADRFGRRPLLLAGAVLFVASSSIYGSCRTTTGLLGVRILHGAGMGLYPTGSAAMISDLAPPARRGEAMGLWGAAANLALALGPLAAVGISERLGFGWLFAISAAVALVALAIAITQRETMEVPAAASLAPRALLSPAVASPCLVVFCLMATYGIQAAFLPLYARSQDTNPGLFFLILALVVALVRGYAGQISDRVGRVPVTCLGMGLTAAAMTTLALGAGPWTLAAAGLLYGLGFGSAQPALMAWTVDLVSADDRGRAMGTFYTALELGIAVGAIGFGALLTWTGYSGMFFLGAALTVVGGAIAALRLRTGRAHDARGPDARG